MHYFMLLAALVSRTSHKYVIAQFSSRLPTENISPLISSLKSGIIIPGAWTKETMLLIMIAGSLVARSASDIWMIQSVTMIETTIIQMDRRRFLQTLMKYCAALPLVRVKTISLNPIRSIHLQ